MSIFSSLIKPSLAVSMLRNNLSKQLNKKIIFFSLVYTASTNILEFICDGQRYKFDDNNIKKLITGTAKNQLKKNQTLDVLVANIDDKNNCDAKLYYTEIVKGIPQKTFVTYKF